MKKSRKLISLLMALAMIFALAIPAFAATTTATAGGEGTITITNAVAGETYTAYKMLNLSYNTTTGSYSYTVADGWGSFFEDDSTVSQYFDVDADGYVTSTLEDDADALATIAKLALEYAKKSTVISAAGSVVADADGATITGLELGYYLVDTTLGTLCSIDSTDTTATIVEKNSTVPTEDKTVSSDGENYNETNSASIGDTVYYQIKLGNLANKSNVSVVDTLSEGLTLVTGDNGAAEVTVTLDGTEVNASDTTYTVTFVVDSDGTTTLTIAFTDAYLATLSSDAVLTVAYSAVINESAVIGGNGNTNNAVLNYGTDHTVKDTTTTYVYGIDIYKYTNVVTENGEGATTEKTALPGAEFVLYKYVNVTDEDGTAGNVRDYAVVKDGKLNSWTTDEADRTVLVSGEDGKISVVGLAAGTYCLEEIEAPVGYNKLSGEIEVVIDNEGNVTYSYGEKETGTGTIEVENKAGTELPSTGGMGTTVFYIFGGAMVLCAVVLLVTRRRMDNEQ